MAISISTALNISTDKIGINQATPLYTLDINSNTAMRIPRGTSGQAPADAEGLIRYNQTKTQFEGNDGANWTGLGGVIDRDQDTYITAEATIETPDVDTLKFFTAGVERMVISPVGLITVGGSLNVLDIAVNGGDIFGPVDGSLSLRSDTEMYFQVDLDADGANIFSWQNGTPAQVMALDESGNLNTLGDLTVQGGKITLSLMDL